MRFHSLSVSSYRFVPIGILYINLSFCATFIFQTWPNIPIGVQVEAVDGVATVFGQYRNQLSARVADIKVVSPSAPVNGGKVPVAGNPGKALN